MWISQTPWQRHRDTASPTGPDMMIPGERETVMDRAAGADQANAVRELIMRQFSFEGPRLYSEQGRHFLELMTGLNAGLSDFLVRRGNRNVEACTRLMQSRSLPEIFLLQAQWLRDAADDYNKETARLSDAYTKLLGSSGGRRERITSPVPGARIILLQPSRPSGKRCEAGHRTVDSQT